MAQAERTSALKKKEITKSDPLLNSPVVQRENKTARLGEAIAMSVTPPPKVFPAVPPFHGGQATGSDAGNVPPQALDMSVLLREIKEVNSNVTSLRNDVQISMDQLRLEVKTMREEMITQDMFNKLEERVVGLEERMRGIENGGGNMGGGGGGDT